MHSGALAVLLFVACAAGLCVTLLFVGHLLGPRRSNPAKRMPYESGMDPIHAARRRFDFRFYLLAITFLVFDVELLFLYPWAAASRPAVAGDCPDFRAGDCPDLRAGDCPDLRAGDCPDLRAAKMGLSPSASGSTRPSDLDRGLSPAASEPRWPAPRGIDAAVSAGLVESRPMVFIGVMAFLALMVLGLVYDWRKGVFRWR